MQTHPHPHATLVFISHPAAHATVAGVQHNRIFPHKSRPDKSQPQKTVADRSEGEKSRFFTLCGLKLSSRWNFMKAAGFRVGANGGRIAGVELIEVLIF